MDGRLTQSPEQEIAELREEIRKIREEQQKQDQQNGNGQNNGAGEGNDNKAQASEGEQKGKDDDADKPKEEKKPHPLRKAILIGTAVLVVAGAVIWWLSGRNYESTDDAMVDAHTSGIAARVPGNVAAVYVDENRFVSAGEVIADLDPRDYRIAVARVRAALRQAQQQVLSEQSNIPVTQVTNSTDIANAQSTVSGSEAAVAAAQRNYEAALAKVTEARANAIKAQSDVERYRPLAEKDEVPREQFDQILANAAALTATQAANQASAQAALQQVDQRRAQLTQAQHDESRAVQNAPRLIAIRQANTTSRQAAVAAASAQLQQAELNLSYCKITTPVAGIVAKRFAEVGQNVTPGQQVVLIAEVGDMWVTANFRETQLRRMRAGQSVRIHVDALGKDFDGYVGQHAGSKRRGYEPAAAGKCYRQLR